MKRSSVVFSFLLPLLLALCLYRLLSTPSRVSAYSSGPPPSTTGAPGEGTCHDCHNTYDINDPSGGVTIEGLPNSYVPGGDPLSFAVTVFQDGTNDANIDWGFEITVLDANNLFAGTLVATDAVNTQVATGFIDGQERDYIEQTFDGIFYNPAGFPSATWTMTWVPPCPSVGDVGPVTFYVAGNAGAGRGRSGTYVFVNNQTVSGPAGNFVAHALPLSDLARGPRAVWPPRSARAPRFAPLSSHRAWLGFAPHRNGVAHLLPAPVSAHDARG